MWNLSVLGHKLVFYTVTNELKFSCLFSLFHLNLKIFLFNSTRHLNKHKLLLFCFIILRILIVHETDQLVQLLANIPWNLSILNAKNVFTFYHFMVFCVSCDVR